MFLEKIRAIGILKALRITLLKKPNKIVCHVSLINYITTAFFILIQYFIEKYVIGYVSYLPYLVRDVQSSWHLL